MLSKEANDFEPIFSAAVTAPSGKDGPVEGKRRMIVDCAMEVEKARLIRRPPSSSIWTLACTPNKKIQRIANANTKKYRPMLPPVWTVQTAQEKKRHEMSRVYG